MPITSSAKKAMRTSARRHEENLASKTAYKKAIKEVKKAEAVTAEQLQKAQSTLDKAVKTKLLHRNTASRLFSRLTKAVQVTGEAKPAKAAKAPKTSATKTTKAKTTKKAAK